MKHLSVKVLFIALLAASGDALAAERIVTLSVKNMTCVSCPYIVKRPLERVEGVKAVDVSLEEQQAIVRYDDAKADVEELTAATADFGFPSSVIGLSRHE